MTVFAKRSIIGLCWSPKYASLTQSQQYKDIKTTGLNVVLVLLFDMKRYILSGNKHDTTLNINSSSVNMIGFLLEENLSACVKLISHGALHHCYCVNFD